MIRDENKKVIQLEENEMFGRSGPLRGDSICNFCKKNMPRVWDVVCSVCRNTFCYSHVIEKNGHWICLGCRNKEL